MLLQALCVITLTLHTLNHHGLGAFSEDGVIMGHSLGGTMRELTDNLR